ncbi:MAG: hypothetical protein ABIH10_01535 [Spirochaetota bacterium]
MEKGQFKQIIKDLPVNTSLVGMALLLGLSERGAVALSEILAGPGRGIGRSYQRVMETKDFWDYYDELKNLKKESARTILWRLQKKGLVDKKKTGYKITTLGLRAVKNFQEKEKVQWDGKWRIVMFDIPEKNRDGRNWLRWQLISLEYKPIQKSVFMGKSPLAEDLYEEILFRKLNNCVRLMTVGEVDDDEMLNF